MMHDVLTNWPDEYEAEGPFEIRPEWPGQDDEDDSWEVARPTSRTGRMAGIMPGAICVCRSKAHAEAVKDALNNFGNQSCPPSHPH